MIKIAFYGKSGSGKSTIAQVAKKFFEKQNLSIEVIKFAEPLYRLQSEFYKTAGVEVGYYDQDQTLMEDIAKHLRIIDPKSLVKDFNSRLIKSTADVVINDDVRDTKDDFPYLKEQEFVLIRIYCEEEVRIKRLEQRNDINIVKESDTTKDIDKIQYDFLVDTTSENFEETKELVINYLEKIVKDEKEECK